MIWAKNMVCVHGSAMAPKLVGQGMIRVKIETKLIRKLNTQYHTSNCKGMQKTRFEPILVATKLWWYVDKYLTWWRGGNIRSIPFNRHPVRMKESRVLKTNNSTLDDRKALYASLHQWMAMQSQWRESFKLAMGCDAEILDGPHCILVQAPWHKNASHGLTLFRNRIINCTFSPKTTVPSFKQTRVS